MSRAAKRKRRVSRMELGNACLVGRVLECREYRDGCEHVFKIDLGDDYHSAEIIHRACVAHVVSVRESRASSWRMADQSAKRMGVQS